MNYIKMYIIAFFVFLIIDAVWLGIISKNLYKKELGHLMSKKPNFIAAGLFYLLFLVGLVYFVINPSIINNDLPKLFISSGLFGLITYSTYDLTNFFNTLKSFESPHVSLKRRICFLKSSIFSF